LGVGLALFSNSLSLMAKVEKKDSGITSRLTRAISGLITPAQATPETDFPLGGPNPTYIYSNQLLPSDPFGAYKAVIPDWLYKPPYGKPRKVNLPELRRLAATPHITACINTLINEVTSLPWEITVKKENTDSANQDATIQKVTNFFKNPDPNKENFKLILRQALQDVLELDSGTIVKTFTRDSYYKDEDTQQWFLKPLGQRNLHSIKAYDGINFILNPDIYGILPEQIAYWQYSWVTYQRPISFARDEVVYMVEYPQTSTGVYGRSGIEVLKDIAFSLLYSVDWLKDFYSNNSIPEGVFSVADADNNIIEAFRERWKSQMTYQDKWGDDRRRFHIPPILNVKDLKWNPIQLSNRDLQMLETQQWWLKIVQAVMNVTPSELGFTESVNRATDLSQSEVFKRKGVKPLVDLLEFHITTEIVSEFSEDLEFKFIQKDPVDERRRKEMAWQEIKLGTKTKNEYRQEFGETEEDKAPIEGGDIPMGQGGNTGEEIGAGFDEMFDELSPNDKNPDKPVGFRSFADAFSDWDKEIKSRTQGARDKKPRKRRVGETELPSIEGKPINGEVWSNTKDAIKKIGIEKLNGIDKITFETSYAEGEVMDFEPSSRHLNIPRNAQELDKPHYNFALAHEIGHAVQLEKAGDKWADLDKAKAEKFADEFAEKYYPIPKDWEKHKEKYVNTKSNRDALPSNVNADCSCNKAITTQTGNVGTNGSALIPVYLEKRMTAKLTKFYNQKLKEILADMNNQKDIEGKAINTDAFKALVERIQSFLFPSDTVQMEISEITRESYTEAHDSVEKRLNMNIPIDQKGLNIMKEMTFNDVKGMSEDIAKNLRRSLFDGYQKGESIKQLSDRVKQEFEVTDSRAKMIARTTMTKVNNTARMKAYKESGVVKEVQWMTAGDAKVCKKFCKPRENKVYKLKEAPQPVINSHPSCRCQLLPYFKE